MKNYRKIIEDMSDNLSQSGLNYRGIEYNTSVDSGFETADLKILICRLSTYRDTAQSFTHPLLYRIISGAKNIFADMAYLPPPPDIGVFRKNGIPLLLPVITKADPLSFDVIAVSNSLVQELLNLETLLRDSGVETDYSARIGDEGQPLIILGGSNSANCHFLMNENSPVDLIYTGEDPSDISKLFDKIAEYRRSGLKKIELIERLFGEFSVVSPVLGQSGIKNKISPDYFDKVQPAGAPVQLKEDPNSSNLVISRGCPWFCSFCNESFRTKPYGEETVEKIINSALRLKKENGSDEVSLFSFNFNAHSKIGEIICELHRYFRIVSLKSQRFDVLSLKAEFIKIMQYSGKTGITCGLEGISSRLRSYLSKDLNRIELEQSLTSLLTSPIRTLKIFLIATGLENEDDFKELQELAAFINCSSANRPRPPRIVFSLTPLVRFPGTPQGMEKAYSAEIMQKISDRISAIVTSGGFEFRTAGSVYEYFVSQVLLRNCSKEFYGAVNRAVKDSGFIYFDSVKKGFYDRLCANLKELGAEPDSFLNNNIGFRHFNSNIAEGFLDLAAGKLRQLTDIPTCNQIKNKSSVCNACGACTSEEERESAMNFSRGRNLTVDDLKRIQAEYSNGCLIELRLNLTEKCSNLTDKYLGAVFSSALFRSVHGSEKFVKRFINFVNRTRFSNPELTGKETAVFLCDLMYADELKEAVKSKEFKSDFEKNAQGFGIVGEEENSENNVIVISITGGKKIDTSFIGKFHIKSTVVKIKDGIYEAQVSKDGLKKKQFSKVIINIPENIIEVCYGEKFDLNEFIKILCDSYKLKSSGLKIFSL
jgi:radical SAM superfamily enzyme YgiQ (UPF0313 family)